MTIFSFSKHASALSVVAILGTPALATPKHETVTGGTFTFYGQFNPSYFSFDDGVSTTGQFAGNAASRSRIGLWLRQPIGENELRFRFEVALGLGSTEDFSQTNSPKAIDWGRAQLRHADLQFETHRLGTFYFGQGRMASDGIGSRDLSDTDLAASVSIGDLGGAFEFRTSTGALSGVEIGDAFSNLDGSRRGRIRYDTPEFGGFTFGIAYGHDILSAGNTDKFYDIALGYESELDNGVELGAGLGHQVRKRVDKKDRKDTFASVSMLFPWGYNFTVAAGDRNASGHYRYAKVGYIRDVFSVGATALSVDFYSGVGTETEGSNAESVGLGVVQEFDDQNVEAYFGYRNYSYSDKSATSFHDAESFVIGARWRF